MNELFSDFDLLAATLVHEIKNPLALVRANLDYIELCDTEKRYSQSYSAMKAQLEKTDGILSDFVGLMMNAGAEDTQVDLRAAAEEVAADYASRGPEFVIELPPGLVIHGNGKLIGIVFSNAVKNAVEAGAERVIISGERLGRSVRVTISDDGCGLAEDTMEMLQGGGGYTTKKYGNGLGVMISKRVIAAAGGSYEIGNASDGGCEVRIELPTGRFRDGL